MGDAAPPPTRVLDPERLAALGRTGLLDSPPEEAFDRLTRLAADLLRTPIAALSLVGEDRQFFKSAVGLAEPAATTREMPLSHSWCQIPVETGAPLVVTDARIDPRTAGSAPIDDGTLTYAGMPLTGDDGHTLGAFCVFGDAPREWTEEDLHLLRELAASAQTELDLRRAARQAQERAAALASSEERTRLIVDQASDGFVAMDAEGRITDWNASAETMFGWRAAEVIGRTVADVIVPPSLREAHMAGVERFLRTGRAKIAGTRVTLSALHRDGHEFPVELSLSALDSAGSPTFTAFISDVSERHRAERLLRAQHATTRVLAESSTLDEALPRILETTAGAFGWDAAYFWELDRDAGVLRVDQRWSAPDTFTAPLDDVTTDLELEIGSGVPGRAWAHGRPEWARDVATSPGLPRSAAAREVDMHAALAVPVSDPDGELLGVLELISREIRDEEVALVEALSATAGQIGEFLRRKRAEEEHERLKDEFLALVSHELRTPLSSILGYVEMLIEEESADAPPVERRRDTSTRQRFLHIVQRNSRRLQRLVGDLLFVAQLDAGRLALEPGEADLALIAREAVEAAAPHAERRGIVLTASGPEKLPLAGDPDRLGQALDNLISNAVKYTPEGGTVSVHVAVGAGTCRVEVADTGIGVPLEQQDRLFTRFFRASSATDQQISGVGLGLVIAKAIVESHDGAIGFHSTPGTGSTFWLEIPLSPTQPPPEKAL